MYYDLEFWFLFVLLASILTYLVWGFIVAFEIVLAMAGSHPAQDWLKAHHGYKALYAEVLIFYPMILLGYLFLELIPHYLFGVKHLAQFDMQKLFDLLYGGKRK